MKTKTTIDIDEVETLVRLCEAQRDLCYHLDKYREALSLRLKELEHIQEKATKVQTLKQKFKGNRELWLTLTPDEVKQVNNILQARHIRI